MKKVYETLKVFDCQKMPDEVKKAYFDFMRENSNPNGNDCYLDWHNEMWTDDLQYGFEGDGAEHFKLVNKWLIENGLGETEDCLIKYWW